MQKYERCHLLDKKGRKIHFLLKEIEEIVFLKARSRTRTVSVTTMKNFFSCYQQFLQLAKTNKKLILLCTAACTIVNI
jgi:hypothetical protein